MNSYGTIKIINNDYVYPTYTEFVVNNFSEYKNLYIENKFPKLGEKGIIIGSELDEIGERIYLVKTLSGFVYLIERGGFEYISLKGLLEPGLVVETKSCGQYFINNQLEIIGMDSGQWFTLIGYDNDLKNQSRDLSRYDIVKIYNGRKSLFWEREQEVDWKNVPLFQDVWVRDSKEDKWRQKAFIRCESGFTKTPFVVIDKNTREISNWRYCKLKNS